MADALGSLARLCLPPGRRHDSIGVPPLIGGGAFDALPGDRAFDADRLREELDSHAAAFIACR